MRRTFEIARAMAVKDLRVALTYRISFVTSIVTSLYGLILFHFISRVVGAGAVVGTPDEYFRFIVVGYAVTNVLRASTASAAVNARRDQVEGTLEILATQPVPLLSLGLGWSAWPVVESLAEAVVMLALAIPLGFGAADPEWISVIVALCLSALCFVGIGFIGAASVVAFQQGGGITGFAAAGMTLLSGAFFPLSVLPGWLHALAYASPLTYSLRALRGAIIDGRSVPQLWDALLPLAAFAVVLLPLGVLALSAGLRHARAGGLLSRF